MDPPIKGSLGEKHSGRDNNLRRLAELDVRIRPYEWIV